MTVEHTLYNRIFQPTIRLNVSQYLIRTAINYSPQHNSLAYAIEEYFTSRQEQDQFIVSEVLTSINFTTVLVRVNGLAYGFGAVYHHSDYTVQCLGRSLQGNARSYTADLFIKRG